MNSEKINVLAFASASGMLQRDLFVLTKKYGRTQTKTIQEWITLLSVDFTIPKIISSSEETEIKVEEPVVETAESKSKQILKKIKGEETENQ